MRRAQAGTFSLTVLTFSDLQANIAADLIRGLVVLHLTAMTMPLAEVRGGIAISGIYDLEPIRLNYLNEKLRLDAVEADRNSPVRHLPATAGELVVAYGTRELPELCRQSIEYGRVWIERALPGRLLPVDGADHFAILEALARPEGVLTQALPAMLGR
jgi:arylformamidase